MFQRRLEIFRGPGVFELRLPSPVRKEPSHITSAVSWKLFLGSPCITPGAVRTHAPTHQRHQTTNCFSSNTHSLSWRILRFALLNLIKSPMIILVICPHTSILF